MNEDTMREIKVAVNTAPGEKFLVGQATIDAPRDDEILVRIAGVGLCHSDLLARDGIIPFSAPGVLGHEGAGEVVAIGASVASIKVGDHVVLTFASCGCCRFCERGEPAYCQHSGPLNFGGGRADGSTGLRTADGPLASHFFGQSSFAAMALASERNAIVVDRSLPIELLGPLGCGVQTGAGAIMNALACRAGSSILITGGGSLGLSAVLAAVVQQCSTVIVSEPHEVRRRLALDLGATQVIDPMVEDLAATVRTIAPEGVDYAFDTTGVAKVIEAAAATLGMRGALAMAGVPLTPSSAVALPVLPLVALGQRVVGTVEGDSDPHIFIPHLIALYQSGHFPFDRLIRTYSLDQINQAVEDHHSAVCVKAVLIPSLADENLSSPSPSGVAGEQRPTLFRSCRGHDRPVTGLGWGLSRSWHVR